MQPTSQKTPSERQLRLRIKKLLLVQRNRLAVNPLNPLPTGPGVQLNLFGLGDLPSKASLLVKRQRVRLS